MKRPDYLRNAGKVWSTFHIKELIEMWEEEAQIVDIARVLERTEYAVMYKINDLRQEGML